MTFEAVCQRIPFACPNGTGYKAPCPMCQFKGAEPEAYRLKIRVGHKHGRHFWRAKCEAGCDEDQILFAFRLTRDDQWFDVRPRGFASRAIAQDVAPARSEFLVGKHILKGQAHLVDAGEGAGKTRFILGLAASLSRGYDPLADRRIEPITTIYFGREDDKGLYRAAYERWGGDLSRLVFVDERFVFDKPARYDDLRYEIQANRAGIVAFDPIVGYTTISNANDPVEVGNAMSPLRDVAMDTGAALLNVRHFSKGANSRGGNHALSELGGGAAKWAAEHRGILVIRVDPTDPRPFKRRIVQCGRGSFDAAPGEPFGFYEDGDSFEWVRGVDVSVFEDAAAGATKGKRGECVNLLRSLLENGPRPMTELRDAAEAEGHSFDTLKRAKTAIGVVSKQRGKRHFWMLAKDVPAWGPGEGDEYDPYADE